MAAFDANRYVKDLMESMNSKNPEAILRHYGENAELKDPSTPQAIRGKAAIRRNMEQWAQGFGELDFRVKDSLQSANKIAVLIDGKARHTGEFEIAPGETIPATNKTVKMEIAMFLTVESDGKIVKDVTVFDMASMMQQLGLMPSPQAGGMREPAGREAGTPTRSR